MRARPILLPLCSLLVVCLAGAIDAAPAYTFSLDGRPFDAKVLPVQGERLGKPGPGDLGFLDGIPFVLRRPGHYQFRSGGEAGFQFTCRIDDGEDFVALVRVGRAEKIANRLIDPLAGLEDGEFRNFMGIDLRLSSSRWDEVLERVDWSRTALRIVAEPDEPDLPAIHIKTRYLSLDASGTNKLRNLSALRGLSQLRYLELTLPPEATVSLAALSRLPDLRNLNVRGGQITDVRKTETQKALRFLKLRTLHGLDSVAFARKFPFLRVLKVDETDVTDLRPLAGLKDLRLLSVNSTRIDALPPLENLPSLRDLRLHSTPIAKDKEKAKKFIAPLRPKMNVLVKNWDPAIKAFEAMDRETPPPESPVLFIGSSSARMWDLEKSFPDLPTINRGFGGSELSDSLRYFDRIVLPYRPRAILLYAGDNDINNGETVEQVVADYKSFAAKVRSRLPDAHFAFLPIKPSLKRWNLWPEMNRANQAIRALSEADDHLHYLDTASPMLGADGKPIPGLFADDGLHLNEEGYALWNSIVKPWMAEL